jgi:hypothetical protein
MSRLSRAIKEEIAKEILKSFKLKTPEEFAKEIEAIATSMMTQEERDIRAKLYEYKSIFSFSLHDFNLYNVSNYLSGYRIVIPSRMHKYDSEFRDAISEVCDAALETHKDKQKLIDMVNACTTIKNMRRNLPQFSEQIDAVLSRMTADVPAVTFDTSFLDKYKETK